MKTSRQEFHESALRLQRSMKDKGLTIDLESTKEMLSNALFLSDLENALEHKLQDDKYGELILATKSSYYITDNQGSFIHRIDIVEGKEEEQIKGLRAEYANPLEVHYLPEGLEWLEEEFVNGWHFLNACAKLDVFPNELNSLFKVLMSGGTFTVKGLELESLEFNENVIYNATIDTVKGLELESLEFNENAVYNASIDTVILTIVSSDGMRYPLTIGNVLKSTREGDTYLVYYTVNQNNLLELNFSI